ncbi:MAG: TonB family protein [Caulobacteraceae bacterium]|nr:TonB family protein [Caulobacter sp.]
MQVATQEEETPVEVVVEKPEPPKPPPPKPPEPKQPEPPKPKEDLSPAYSAPRAPTEEKVKTETKEAKTEAPTHLDTPTQGAPQAAPPAAAPAKEPTPQASKEEAAKEEEKKENAEALDKAKRKAAKKQARTKEVARTSNQKVNPNLLAALGGAPSFGAQMHFARPTPKAKIYGGTEDMRWMSEVEAMLEAKVQQLPKTAHYQAGGKVAICFHVGPDGRVLLQEFCAKSGYPDIDALAMRALHAAAPFPPPPPGLERGLVWVSSFDGQVPVLHFR